MNQFIEHLRTSSHHFVTAVKHLRPVLYHRKPEEQSHSSYIPLIRSLIQYGQLVQKDSIGVQRRKFNLIDMFTGTKPNPISSGRNCPPKKYSARTSHLLVLEPRGDSCEAWGNVLLWNSAIPTSPGPWIGKMIKQLSVCLSVCVCLGTVWLYKGPCSSPEMCLEGRVACKAGNWNTPFVAPEINPGSLGSLEVGGAGEGVQRDPELRWEPVQEEQRWGI